MDVVPLLAHKEEESFRLVHFGSSKVIRDRLQDSRNYRDIQSLGMGQSVVKGNQIQDSFQNDWIMPNSHIKCESILIIYILCITLITYKVCIFLFLIGPPSLSCFFNVCL